MPAPSRMRLSVVALSAVAGIVASQVGLVVSAAAPAAAAPPASTSTTRAPSPPGPTAAPSTTSPSTTPPPTTSAPSSTSTTSTTAPASRRPLAALVPDQPAPPTASPGNGTAKVDWTAPGDGGSPITGYTVTASPGGATCTATAPSTTCVVSGLDVTTTPTFTVVATNAVGDSLASAASPPITFPPTVGRFWTFPWTPGAGSLGMAAGPDGAIWFTNYGGFTIERVTTTGEITTYADPSIVQPWGITAGPDGAMWFTNSLDNSIGRIDVTTKAITAYTDGATVAGSIDIATGPDGAIWFTNFGSNSIGRIDPTTKAITSYTDPAVDGPFSITAGPDGALWFTNLSGNSIGRIDPTTKAITNHTDPALSPSVAITAGPDGAVWFTNGAGIGRITTDGTITTYADAAIGTPAGIAGGPDRAIWFVDQLHHRVGRITTDGAITTYLTAGLSGPIAITSGPDGAMWFTDVGTVGSVWAGRTPGAPIAPSATAGDAMATVSWTPPAPDGVFPTAYASTGFTVAAYQGGTRVPGATCTAAAPTSTCDVTGLTNGTPYTFTVTATNVVGTGPESVATSAVTPAAAPGAPTSVLATPGNTTATVTWTAPASDGGSPIDGYTVVAVQDPTKTCTWTTGPLTCQVTGLTNGSPYRFTVTAHNAVGDGPASLESNTVHPGAPFHGIDPVRVLDSRPGGLGPFASPWGPGTTRDVTVAVAGTVPADADAVVINLTATNTTAASFLSVWPTGGATPDPLVSSLNWSAGQTVANAVTVKVGAGGQITIANPTGEVDVIVDVVGWYGHDTGAGYTPTSPTRVLDSRAESQVGPYATPWTAGTTRDVTVAGIAGIPADADAVVLNVTADRTTAQSFLSIWPTGTATPIPLVSSVNWVPGQTVPNAVTAKVGTGGQIRIFNPSGQVEVIVDVVGYYRAGSGSLFVPIDPTRVADSRPESTVGPFATPWGPGTGRDVPVAGVAGIPVDATAVVTNTTVTTTTAASFLSSWPAGAATPDPLVSSLNWITGQTVANAITAGVGTGGATRLSNASGQVDVIVDAAGWFTPAGGPAPI